MLMPYFNSISSHWMLQNAWAQVYTFFSCGTTSGTFFFFLFSLALILLLLLLHCIMLPNVSVCLPHSMICSLHFPWWITVCVCVSGHTVLQKMLICRTLNQLNCSTMLHIRTMAHFFLQSSECSCRQKSAAHFGIAGLIGRSLLF